MRVREWTRTALMLTASAVATAGTTAVASAQTPARHDSTQCDSVLAAARVDSVAAGMFISAIRTDGSLDARRLDQIAMTVGASFVPPKPFRLSVFSGPARMRMFRPVATDTASLLRAPSVIGFYRLVVGGDSVRRLTIIRASLMPGFDSAAVAAVREAVTTHEAFAVPDNDNAMTIDVRFSSDSIAGAHRIASAWFPRMPVMDAVPRGTNPPAEFPEDERADSVTTGEAVLRFVVDRAGEPAIETLQIVRATSLSFVRAAITAMPKQHFIPATVHGCAVAQVVDYPFSFVLPGNPTNPAVQPSLVKAPIRH